MSVGELIVNRVHTDGLGGHSVAEVARSARARARRAPCARVVAANLADFDVLARRDRDTIAEPVRGMVAPTSRSWSPHLDEDVQDLLGLARIAEQLFD